MSFYNSMLCIITKCQFKNLYAPYCVCTWYMHVCIQVSIHVCACGCGGLKWLLGVFIHCLSALFIFLTGVGGWGFSHWTRSSLTQLSWLACEHESHLSLLLSAGSRDSTAVPSFYVLVWQVLKWMSRLTHSITIPWKGEGLLARVSTCIFLTDPNLL